MFKMSKETCLEVVNGPGCVGPALRKNGRKKNEVWSVWKQFLCSTCSVAAAEAHSRQTKTRRFFRCCLFAGFLKRILTFSTRIDKISTLIKWIKKAERSENKSVKLAFKERHFFTIAQKLIEILKRSGANRFL